MTVMVAALSLGIAVTTLTWIAVTVRPPAHREVVGNLSVGLPAATQQAAVDRQFGWMTWSQRFVHPIGIRLVDQLLTRAGRPRGWSLGSMLLGKLAAMTVAVPVAMIISSAGGARVIVAVATVAVAFFAPELLLYSKGVERQQRIANELADTLDQMTISVEAGLGFDAAMARAAAAGSGPLAEEFVRTLQDLQVGVPRREAFRGLADRTTVVDLKRFTAALLQSDAYGVPLADTLRVQAEEIRRKRRYRAEQRAMQVPVKIVFPLVMCILPTLFIVLLGPAVISLISTFR